ncbi:MAG: hypothetical protein R3F20_00450 [Planctomycetota bacterium]
MTRFSRRTALIAALGLAALTLSPRPLSGQGVGTPSGTGRVARIDFDHRQVGVPLLVRFHGFSPTEPLAIFVANSENPMPLANDGYGPAVLGPDLFSPAGAVIFDGLYTDSQGEFTITVVAPPVLSDFYTNLQAVTLDPAAPYGGAAFSEHRRVRFSFDPRAHAFALDNGDGTLALVEAFPSGHLASPPDPRLLDVTPRDLVLVNANEAFPGDAMRPALEPGGVLGDGLALPGDFRLHLVRSATDEDGLLLVDGQGRIETLLWAQGTALDPALLPEIAASPVAPWIAVLADNPLPEYGGGQLFVCRVDGWNAPGSHERFRVVPVPAGLDVSPCSTAFLDGALFFGDGLSELHRYDLASGVVTPVVFPPSGGAPPIYLDEVCAVAANGAALALGAGFDEDTHDVYAVLADGTAVNVTQLPADYEDAGPGTADGQQLAVSPDGSMVAYMRTVIETETYVRGIAPGSPEMHVTNGTDFIDSIDTVIGVGFRANGHLVFAAGKDILLTDLYRTTVTPGGTVTTANVTVSSGFPTPVFDLGAQLVFESRFEAANALATVLRDATGAGVIAFVDDAGQSSQFPIEAVLRVEPVAAGSLVVDRSPTGVLRARVFAPATATAPPALLSTWTSAAGHDLAAFARSATGLAGFVAETATGPSTLVEVDGAGALLAAAGPTGTTRTLAMDGNGRFVAAVTDLGAGTTAIEERAPGGSAWTPLTASFAATEIGRFIR